MSVPLPDSGRPKLATIAERREALRNSGVRLEFDDSGFHLYIEAIVEHPDSADEKIEDALLQQGVQRGLAQELILFVPLAFGRAVVEELGVKCCDLFQLHNLDSGTEHELPLANELAYVWAKAMIGLYRTPERNNIFGLIARRSAEVDAINNALNSGVPAESLSESAIGPPIVYLHRGT